jgi:hypothetical protein
MESPGTAQPGLAPDTASPRVAMLAALYGSLVRDPWLDPGPPPQAHALFGQRSAAMGWLDDRSDETGETKAGLRGLWTMYDAGWGDPEGANSPISWFHVGIRPESGRHGLPVQPFLRCAGDVTIRIGKVDINAVVLLLPSQIIDVSPEIWSASLASSNPTYWFSYGNAQSRAAVKIDLRAGIGSAIADIGDSLKNDMRELDHHVFTWVSHAVERPPPDQSLPFDDSLWNGPAQSGITVQGMLAEWSLEAIGWLGETLTEAIARLGMHAPVVLTVHRSGAASQLTATSAK